MGRLSARSLDWSPDSGADGGVGAAEVAQAGAHHVPGRGPEVALPDALDGRDHGLPAAGEVAGLERLLHPLADARRRFADREEDLPHRAVDPVLRVPEREPARLQVDALALRADTLPAGQVVEGELDVVQLGTEVGVIGA